METFLIKAKSRFRNRKTFITLVVLLIIVSAVVYGVHAIQDWFEYDFDFPAQDCLMNTQFISGTVKDEQNNPIENARIEIKGHHLSCDSAVRFPLGKTDTSGTFEIAKAVYSPFLKNSYRASAPTLEPKAAAEMIRVGGVYEVSISADGYIPYYKADMTDEIFSGLSVVLKKR